MTRNHNKDKNKDKKDKKFSKKPDFTPSTSNEKGLHSRKKHGGVKEGEESRHQSQDQVSTFGTNWDNFHIESTYDPNIVQYTTTLQHSHNTDDFKMYEENAAVMIREIEAWLAYKQRIELASPKVEETLHSAMTRDVQAGPGKNRQRRDGGRYVDRTGPRVDESHIPLHLADSNSLIGSPSSKHCILIFEEEEEGGVHDTKTVHKPPPLEKVSGGAPELMKEGPEFEEELPIVTSFVGHKMSTVMAGEKTKDEEMLHSAAAREAKPGSGKNKQSQIPDGGQYGDRTGHCGPLINKSYTSSSIFSQSSLRENSPLSRQQKVAPQSVQSLADLSSTPLGNYSDVVAKKHLTGGSVHGHQGHHPTTSNLDKSTFSSHNQSSSLTSDPSGNTPVTNVNGFKHHNVPEQASAPSNESKTHHSTTTGAGSYGGSGGHQQQSGEVGGSHHHHFQPPAYHKDVTIAEKIKDLREFQLTDMPHNQSTSQQQQQQQPAVQKVISSVESQHVQTPSSVIQTSSECGAPISSNTHTSYKTPTLSSGLLAADSEESIEKKSSSLAGAPLISSCKSPSLMTPCPVILESAQIYHGTPTASLSLQVHAPQQIPSGSQMPNSMQSQMIFSPFIPTFPNHHPQSGGFTASMPPPAISGTLQGQVPPGSALHHHHLVQHQFQPLIIASQNQQVAAAAQLGQFVAVPVLMAADRARLAPELPPLSTTNQSIRCSSGLRPTTRSSNTPTSSKTPTVSSALLAADSEGNIEKKKEVTYNLNPNADEFKPRNTPFLVAMAPHPPIFYCQQPVTPRGTKKATASARDNNEVGTPQATNVTAGAPLILQNGLPAHAFVQQIESSDNISLQSFLDGTQSQQQSNSSDGGGRPNSNSSGAPTPVHHQPGQAQTRNLAVAHHHQTQMPVQAHDRIVM